MDKYAMAAVFVFWYGTAAVALINGLRVKPNGGREHPFRSRRYYFASFLYGLVVTSILLWLYASGSTDEFFTVIVGLVVFLPEALYLFWSQLRLVRAGQK